MSPKTNKPQWSFRVNAKIASPIPHEPDAGRIAAMFGLQDGRSETLWDNFHLEIAAGEIVAIIGPSGAGKSVLLSRIARQGTDTIGLRVPQLSRSDSSATACLGGGCLADRLEVLSRCGLAEAAALITPAKCLSGGQLYRLALARALHSARRRRRPTLVLADEFASSLDSITAAVLCRQVRKLIAGSAVALLLATPRSELLNALQPDRIIVKPIAAGARLVRRIPDVSPADNWQPRIVRGTIADYDALSCFHYLAGRPAAHKRVYVIRSGRWRGCGGPAVAAVLVVSPPLSNVRGRNLATAGRYAGGDRSAAMGLLNCEVECISRVIVHPILRGCGLAVRLVRRAIAAAQTPMVEALAAMGALHPFFEKAGMTAYPLVPDRHTARLLSAAEAVGLTAEDLATVGPVEKLLARKRTKAARFLKKELDLAVRRTFSPKQLSRLTDPVAELCRRTARQYTYYLTAS